MRLHQVVTADFPIILSFLFICDVFMFWYFLVMYPQFSSQYTYRLQLVGSIHVIYLHGMIYVLTVDVAGMVDFSSLGSCSSVLRECTSKWVRGGC